MPKRLNNDELNAYNTGIEAGENYAATRDGRDWRKLAPPVNPFKGAAVRKAWQDGFAEATDDSDDAPDCRLDREHDMQGSE